MAVGHCQHRTLCRHVNRVTTTSTEVNMAQEVLTKDDLKLVETCWQCGGDGVTAIVPKHRDTVSFTATEECDVCNGKGSWPTELGKQLLELIRKFGD